MSTKPDSDTGWSKEFPQVEGFYFARRTQTNVPGLTVIQVWQYEDEWFAYRFANQDDIEAKDFVRSLYEYLGPLSPSDFEQLIRLQKVAAKAQAFLGAINTDIQTEPRPRCEILEISESAGDGGSYNHALLDTVELMETVSALREALTHTGERS